MAERMMRHWIVPTIFLLIASICAPTAGSAQLGFDRPGGDYANMTIRNGDPAACAARCERDARCRAWTFSYPRTDRPAATCWLKNRVTARTESNCCISGVRGASIVQPEIGDVEYGIDRSGGDYRNFETKADAEGDTCAQACQADKRCRAWTYARPGYISGAARCFLKDRVRPPRRRPCCISGVIR